MKQVLQAPAITSTLANSTAWPSFLTSKRIALIAHRLSEKLTQERAYLRHHYTLRRLSDELGIPSYQLSAYFNKIHGMSYGDFINKCRIDHCRQLLAREGGTPYNMRGLANICGFGNRNTLTTVFQKFTGSSPSDYIRQLHTSAGAATNVAAVHVQPEEMAFV
ncbi:helix-turn-helix domain-containing protein [Paraflavitalea pollutisoli]|uniref:helix-turn-helix domain-containing protein n=1 Tax=Paraflavitalea pollutisoli TaxID=3034143 RepID=UPI0023EB551D|nr:helix-turn-helix domain-containing protein [Paraflavitalea sp. H1-2-19X]